MTMDLADLDRGLRAVLRELEPYLSDLVLIGGWVPYLFRHYGPFGAWEGRDTLTRELDVLVDNPLPREGPSSVGHASRRRTLSPERPAAWVRDVQAGEKVEFLTAHGGAAFPRRWPISRASPCCRCPAWNCWVTTRRSSTFLKAIAKRSCGCVCPRSVRTSSTRLPRS